MKNKTSVLKRMTDIVKEVFSKRAPVVATVYKKADLDFLSRQRKKEINLFVKAVMGENQIHFDELPTGTPEGVLFEPEFKEGPKKYTVWPMYPTRDRGIYARYVEIKELKEINFEQDFGMMIPNKNKLRIESILNDDFQDCPFAGLKKKQQEL